MAPTLFSAPKNTICANLCFSTPESAACGVLLASAITLQCMQERLLQSQMPECDTKLQVWDHLESHAFWSDSSHSASLDK